MAITGLAALGATQPPKTTSQPGIAGATGLAGLGQFKNMAATTLQGAQNLQGPDYSKLGALNPGGYSANRNQATTTAQNYFNTQLQDRYKGADQDFAQKMANQGLDPGSEAYKRNADIYGQEKNKAYQDAAFQAYQAGGLEQQQAFNQALAANQQGQSQADSSAAFGLQKTGALLNPLTQLSGQESQEGMQQAGFGFQGGQNQLDRSHDSAMQQAGFGFEKGENAADRSLQTTLQQGQQNWQGGENAADRSHESTMQGGQNKWQGDQNNLQRQLEATLGTQNSDFIRAILAQMGISPANPPSSPSK